MLWSRRTVFMALIVLLPVAIALVLRVLVSAGVPVLRLGSAQVNGPVVFGLMMWGFFVRFGIPVLGVFYGTSIIADEVEDKTITYLFTRPVPRQAVLIGKYLAYLAATTSVLLPAVMLVWLLIAPIGASVSASFPDLVKDLGVLTAGIAVYGALFALAGATLKRPLLVGLIYVFGWETLVMALPGYFKYVTVAYYLQGLVPHAMPTESSAAILQTLFRDTPGTLGSLIGLVFIGAGSLALGSRAVARREYVLEQ
jgi:ABC-2 type transport system permease protein